MGASSSSLPTSPAAGFVRVVRNGLFWGKRDILIIGALLTAFPILALRVVMAPYFTIIGVVPIALLVTLACCGPATQASKSVDELHHAIMGRYQQDSTATDNGDGVDTIGASANTSTSSAAKSGEGLFMYWVRNARWPMSIYLLIVHSAAVYGVFKALPVASWNTLAWAFVLWPISGFGVTAGMHRLWAHRSHTAKRGFFFSHMGWLLVKKDPAVKEAGSMLRMDDLANDVTIALNRACDPWWNLAWCFLFPAAVAHYGWGEAWSVGILVPGVLRYVYVLHATWCVNSLAHLVGTHPYEDTNPAESPFVSIVAVGEGWHNWHHAFPYDYAASEMGISAQWNPTKLFIDLCCMLGLASNPKRAHKAWGIRKSKLEKRMASGKGSLEMSSHRPPLFRRRVMRNLEASGEAVHEPWVDLPPDAAATRPE